jgi:hypothetical protein
MLRAFVFVFVFVFAFAFACVFAAFFAVAEILLRLRFDLAFAFVVAGRRL